jgi:hypothetical protein
MMQHTRKDVDHHVSGQCGNANQGTAQKRVHRNIRRAAVSPTRQRGTVPRWRVGLSSFAVKEFSLVVLPNYTQYRQRPNYRQERGG